MHKKFYQTSDFILYINLILSIILEYFYPTKLWIHYNIFFGIMILIVGWLIVYKSKIEFKKYKQKSGLNNDIKEIINTGIYKYSRNPIYLAILIINIGLSLIINSTWMLIDTLIIAWMLNHLLIKKEEVFLENEFKDKYTEYKNKVRKWI
jgi:protein-S-isoprenylcysteine O-methyltransferase Ste14